MASRRMFSLRIINSARFLKMPVSSQALYFHLGMRADDDGIVEAFTTMRSVGCTEDDLRVLVAKGFVQVLNEDLITYITDWNENNKIRPDRKIDSIYQDLLLKINPDAPLIERKTIHKRTDGQVVDWQMTDKCQASDGQMTDKCQHRLGKDRIGKVSSGKDRIGKENVCSEPQSDSEPEAQTAVLILNDGSEWRPTVKDYEEWCRVYPNVDVFHEFERMRQWCLSNPKKRKTRRGIRKFVTTWLDGEQNKPRKQTTTSKLDQIDQWAERMKNEESNLF